MVNSSSIVREVIQAARRVIFSLCTTAVLERGFGGGYHGFNFFVFFFHKKLKPLEIRLFFIRCFHECLLFILRSSFFLPFLAAIYFYAVLLLRFGCITPAHHQNTGKSFSCSLVLELKK